MVVILDIKCIASESYINIYNEIVTHIQISQIFNSHSKFSQMSNKLFKNSISLQKAMVYDISFICFDKLFKDD